MGTYAGKNVDIAIIGGGAAGLSAAVFACREARRFGKTIRLGVWEKAPRTGKKLLATGNGTCNLTNSETAPSRYHQAEPTQRGQAVLAQVLKAFPAAEARKFFSSIGVESVEKDRGRVYPLSLQAGAVLDCLRLTMAAQGAEEFCSRSVNALLPVKKGWRLETEEGTVQARKVLVCCGGAAAPALGGSADGYSLLTRLGHTRTPLFPAIVQVKTETELVRSLKGIRLDAGVRFCLDGREMAAETGELLFTEYGVSGPAVMHISRCVGDWERRRRGRLTVQLDLLPGWSAEQAERCLAKRRELAGRTREDYLTGFLQKRVGQTLLRAAGLGPLARPAAELSDGEVRCLAALMKDWTLNVTGTQGFGGAQVTAGGIPLEEFNAHTLESRLCPGLYAAGEVLDADGDCGGFNLHWAWASAYAAARGAVASLLNQAD